MLVDAIENVTNHQRFGWYRIGDFVQEEGMITVGIVVGVEGNKLLVGYKNILKKVDQMFLGVNCFKAEKPVDFNYSDIDWIYTRYPHLKRV